MISFISTMTKSVTALLFCLTLWSSFGEKSTMLADAQNMNLLRYQPPAEVAPDMFNDNLPKRLTAEDATRAMLELIDSRFLTPKASYSYSYSFSYSLSFDYEEDEDKKEEDVGDVGGEGEGEDEDDSTSGVGGESSGNEDNGGGTSTNGQVSKGEADGDNVESVSSNLENGKDSRRLDPLGLAFLIVGMVVATILGAMGVLVAHRRGGGLSSSASLDSSSIPSSVAVDPSENVSMV